MRIGASWRLRTPTPALRLEHDHHVPMTLPAGAVLTIVRVGSFSREFVAVEWDDQTLLVFTLDLRERGDQVEGAHE